VEKVDEVPSTPTNDKVGSQLKSLLNNVLIITQGLIQQKNSNTYLD
jgi:hypothetical protein